MARVHLFAIAFNIVFNMFLPLSDYSSDITVIISALLFYGNSLGLIGCRYCLSALPDYEYMSPPCNICTTENYGLQDGGLECGGFPTVLDKIGIIHNQNTCENQAWRVGYKRDAFSKGLCQEDDVCCVKIGDDEQKAVVMPNSNLNQPLTLARCTNEKNIETCYRVGIGENYNSCEAAYKNYKLKEKTQSNELCINGSYYLNNENEFVCGMCNSNPRCCVTVRENKRIVDCEKQCDPSRLDDYIKCCAGLKKIRYTRCRQTPCEMYIRYVSSVSRHIHNIHSWKQNTDVISGQFIGGSFCEDLKFLAALMALTLAFFTLSVAAAWYDDMKNGDASPWEIILVILPLYPIWKASKRLALIYRVNDYEEEAMKYETKLGFREAYLESCFQVHIMFAMMMQLETLLPKHISGAGSNYFSSILDSVYLIGFILSLLASSYGMSKFLVFGPAAFIPTNAPLQGMLSLKFLGVLILNLMYVFRMYAIETTFFSHYQIYDYSSKDLEDEIVPILSSSSLRIVCYLLPAIIPMTINFINLAHSGKTNLLEITRNTPELLIAPAFTPYLFSVKRVIDNEGKNFFQYKVWKKGTLVNAIALGILPQILLVASEVQRDVIRLPFVADPNKVTFTNSFLNAICGSSYANIIFGTASLFFFLATIIIVFAHNDLLPTCYPSEPSRLSSQEIAPSKHIEGPERIIMKTLKPQEAKEQEEKESRDLERVQVERASRQHEIDNEQLHNESGIPDAEKKKEIENTDVHVANERISAEDNLHASTSRSEQVIVHEDLPAPLKSHEETAAAGNGESTTLSGAITTQEGCRIGDKEEEAEEEVIMLKATDEASQHNKDLNKSDTQN